MTELAVLNHAEQVALEECERVIGEGVKSFIETGSALTFVRDNRLYRATHSTFEAYCRERWNLTPQHANRLALAAGVVTALEPTGSIPPPSTERQARELAKVPEPERAEVWREAVERTDGNPTAKAVREVAQERTQFSPKPSVPSPAERYEAAVADFPELAHFADRPARATALADQLRTFDPAEQAHRRENLAKVIRAEQEGRLDPKPDAAAPLLAKADRIFVAANEVTQVAEKLGGAQAVAEAVAHAEPMQIDLWRDQFTDLADLCNRLADACRPKLRRVQ